MMQKVETKSVGLYLLWIGAFGIALILLPYYLGSLIAENNWQMIGLLALGVILSTLYFVEARFLILCTAVCFFFVGSKIEFLADLTLTLRWVFLITLAVRALSHWVLGRVPTRVRGLDLWALSFIALAFYSQTYSFMPYLTFQRSVSLALLYLSIFWGVWNYVQDESKISIIINDLLKVSFIILLVGFMFVGSGRFTGVFVNPNSTGLFATFFMPLAVWDYVCRRRPWVLFLISLLVVNLVLCGSRAALLASAMGTGYALWFYYRDRKYLVLTLVLFAVLFILLSFELFGRSWFTEYFRWENLTTGSGRLEAWKEVFRLIRLRPWLGYGFGTEEHLFYKFDIIFLEHSGAYAHNVYLGLVSQLGVIGAILLFTPLFFFFLRSSYRMSRTPLSEMHWLDPALSGAVFAGLIHATFESWMYSVGSPFAFLFWLLVALAYQLDRASRLKKVANVEAGAR